MKTSPKRTLPSGGGELTFLQEASPANRSASLDEERERMITVSSGRTCLGRYAKFSPLGSLLRTLLVSSRWYSPQRRLKWDATVLSSKRITYTVKSKTSPLKQSAKVLNVQDIASNRLLFQLAPSVRPTKESECGLLPTPTSIDSGSGRMNKSLSPNAAERPTLALAARMGMLLSPSATDGIRTCFSMNALCKHNKKNAEKSNLGEQIAHIVGGGTGLLNPLFVEDMMGFPLMWTTLPFLSQHGEEKALKPTATHGCHK